MDGQILKKLRLDDNLTQSELAKRIDVSESTIRMIELGKRSGSDDVVTKIQNHFNVSRDFLYGKSDIASKMANENEKKEGMIDQFIDELIESGIMTDADDIDDETAKMILNAVKARVALKLKKREKGVKK